MSTGYSLTAEELRVLACLIEKSHTTPEQYPLSSNALTNACNQKSSRDPVVDYTTQLVDDTLQLLRDAGWVRMIRGKGNRTFKHRHVVDEKLGLSTPQQAVLAVLALRGPQSPGELKTRTERYHPFADLAEVETILASLRDLDSPLARNVGRAAGQSQDRWVQLIGQDVLDSSSAPPSAGSPAPSLASSAAPSSAGPPTGAVAVDALADGARREVRSPLIDSVEGVDWSDGLLKEVNESGLDVIHAVMPGGLSFRSFVREVERWNGRFHRHQLLTARGGSAGDVWQAMNGGRTAVVLAGPDASPIEDDPGLIEICHLLGLRFMGLSGLSGPVTVGGGEEQGLNGVGREVLAEMNRVGLVVELGRCDERTALQALDLSTRPAAIVACQPSWWTGMGTASGTSDEVLRALTGTGGMVGLALTASTVTGGATEQIREFSEMVAEAAVRYGPEHLAVGSGTDAGRPPETSPFDDRRGAVDAVMDALSGLGFLDVEIEALSGGNWLRFYERAFGPA